MNKYQETLDDVKSRNKYNKRLNRVHLGTITMAIVEEVFDCRIPLKPNNFVKYTSEGGVVDKYGTCNCGERLISQEKYCPNCGQAQDWSE